MHCTIFKFYDANTQKMPKEVKNLNQHLKLWILHKYFLDSLKYLKTVQYIIFFFTSQVKI